jgi:glycosyltransferase involved in cell wall biosynthesis
LLKVALIGSRNFPARHGGLEVVVENIAQRMAKRQVSVHVFVSADEAVDSRDLESDRLHVYASRSIKGKYWHTASQILSGLALVRKLRPDIVNIHGVGPAFPLAFSKRAFGGVPTLVTAHGLDWERAKWPAVARWAFRFIAVRALKNATSVSCVSESVGTELGRLIGTEVVTTSNGMDSPEATLGHDLDLPEKYVVAVSRLTPEKNLEHIIESYTREVSDLRGPLVIVGGGAGSYASGYEDELRKLARGRAIIFAGQQDREAALSIMSGASMLVSTSFLEARPMTVLEAMHLRVPLVLSDIAPHRELCGDSALYVSPRDPEQLTELLLGPDPGASSRVAQAFVRVSAMTWERSTDTYLTWYREQLDSQSSFA